MLRILGSANPFQHALSRREVLRVGGLAGTALSLPQWLRAESLTAGETPDATFGRARRIMMLYLQGAASQYETWDPKPDAPAEIRGKWGAAATSVPGTFLCDQLPKIARLADRLAIVRSMTHEFNNHSNLWSHKAVTHGVRRLRGAGRRTTGNVMSHRHVLELVQAAGLEVESTHGMGFLGGQALRVIPFKRMSALQESLREKPVLQRLGEDQIYVLRPR